MAGVFDEPPTGADATLHNQANALADALVTYGVALPTALRELETLVITKTLTACDGNKSKAARVLGVARATLYKYLKLNEREDKSDD